MKDIMNFVYEGNDLGAIIKHGKTGFKLWSPFADRVVLRLYKEGNGGEPYETHTMQSDTDGIWSLQSDRNLSGVYYDYEITHGSNCAVAGDPYAKACGVNGARSMVIDLSLTNPLDWEHDRAPDKETEDIIYELHVKEFSYDPKGGFSEALRGKYLAFTEENTSWNGEETHLTGLPYIKALGVNHLQLMPVYDYGSVDESVADSQFNWGYDPMNYNVPEGSYSTDPYHGEVRIQELKAMIQAIHKQGFRVIMDVVYNHTFSADSCLERSAPGYYYRQNKDMSFCDGSGCGNDIASERPMCSKYILDSVLYWTEEYHMDGFRFDLMGLLDTDLMNEIRKELDIRYGKGEKLIYGEPWAAGPSPMERGKIPALRENIARLEDQVGVFGDGIRDAVKGHVFELKAPGFVNGGEGQEEAILHSVSAWCGENLPAAAKSPAQMITYVSAHDNLTLWDKLMISMKEKPDYRKKDSEILRANKLAAAIYLTCQGRLFMLSGEEFGRTKEGIENSYQDSIEINRLDWSRPNVFSDLVLYYKGLIELRKKLPGLCDKTPEAGKRIEHKKIQGKGCVSFLIHNGTASETCPWSDVFVAYHAGKEGTLLSLPEGKWEVLADGESSTHWKEDHAKKIVNKQVTLSPVSPLILGKCEREI